MWKYIWSRFNLHCLGVGDSFLKCFMPSLCKVVYIIFKSLLCDLLEGVVYDSFVAGNRHKAFTKIIFIRKTDWGLDLQVVRRIKSLLITNSTPRRTCLHKQNDPLAFTVQSPCIFYLIVMWYCIHGTQTWQHWGHLWVTTL